MLSHMGRVKDAELVQVSSKVNWELPKRASSAILYLHVEACMIKDGWNGWFPYLKVATSQFFSIWFCRFLPQKCACRISAGVSSVFELHHRLVARIFLVFCLPTIGKIYSFCRFSRQLHATFALIYFVRRWWYFRNPYFSRQEAGFSFS